MNLLSRVRQQVEGLIRELVGQVRSLAFEELGRRWRVCILVGVVSVVVIVRLVLLYVAAVAVVVVRHPCWLFVCRFFFIFRARENRVARLTHIHSRRLLVAASSHLALARILLLLSHLRLLLAAIFVAVLLHFHSCCLSSRTE